MATELDFKVHGVRDLIRSLEGLSDDVEEEFVWELEEAADPVRKQSMVNMRSMENVRSPYDLFRIGVAKRDKAVWVQPAWRRGGGSPRPGMAPHIRKRMERALEQEEAQVSDKVDNMIDRLSRKHGF